MLFDGRAEADNNLAAAAKTFFAEIAADRKTFDLPANPQQVATLSAHYWNAALGDINVQRAGAKTTFDFGEWQSEVASRRNPDGTTSFITISPGVTGFEFLVGGSARKTLSLRDAQHEYLFESR